jgi:hypothetical protein
LAAETRCKLSAFLFFTYWAEQGDEVEPKVIAPSTDQVPTSVKISNKKIAELEDLISNGHAW